MFSKSLLNYSLKSFSIKKNVASFGRIRSIQSTKLNNNLDLISIGNNYLKYISIEISKNKTILKNNDYFNQTLLFSNSKKEQKDLMSLLQERKKRAELKTKVDNFEKDLETQTKTKTQTQETSEICCSDLKQAISMAHLNCMNFLWSQLPQKAQESATLLNYAMSIPQSFSAVEKLLKDRKTISKNNINRIFVGSGTNPLHDAVILSRFDIVRLLFDLFKDSLNLEEHSNANYLTPLLLAAQDPSDSPIFSYLLSKGANPEARGDIGQGIMHMIAVSGNVLRIRDFLSHKDRTKSIDELVNDRAYNGMFKRKGKKKQKK